MSTVARCSTCMNYLVKLHNSLPRQQSFAQGSTNMWTEPRASNQHFGCPEELKHMDTKWSLVSAGSSTKAYIKAL